MRLSRRQPWPSLSNTISPLLFLLVYIACDWNGFAVVLTAPPEPADASNRYVFYLHGSIVTGSDGRPVSKEFGPYEFRSILKRFADDGFVVISEIRTNDQNPDAYAKRVANWISRMKKEGVPSDHISVIGASFGGVIAANVSALLDDQNLNYVILAGLFESEPERDLILHGRVLSIYDEADTHKIVPDFYFHRSSLFASRSIITKTGLGHGLIYNVNAAWYGPTLSWINNPSGQ